MTRHRRHDPDGVDGDAPWRAPDRGRSARPRQTGGDYYQAPQGASGGYDDRPGEATGPPPWELPGWDDPGPAQRRPRQNGTHPSGPLPQVNSGPLPRLPDQTGPPPISGPLPPVPREPWPAERGSYPSARRNGGLPGQDDNGYLRTGSRSSDRGLGSGEFPAYGSGHGYDAGHADVGYDDPGYHDPGYADPGYHDPGYGGSDPQRGGHMRHRHRPPDDPRGGDYAGPGYDDERGYHTGPGYAEGQDYPEEHGRSGGAGYPGADYPEEAGYAGHGYGRDDDYPGQDGYADEAGYQDEDGYPAGQGDGYPGREDAGYPGDDYPPGQDQPQSHHDGYRQEIGEDPGDHGYGGEGWFDDEEEDQAWGDDEYDSGVLPGLSGDEGFDPRRGPAEDGSRRGGGRRPPPGRPPKKRKSAMRRVAPWIALTVLVVVLGIAGAGFLYVWHTYLHPADYSGPGTGSVVVHITTGETAAQVGQQLQTLGVVASARAFSNAAKASGHGSALEPGYYRLHKHMAAALAFALLLKPSSRVQLTVVIPEGMRLSEIIAALGKATGNLKGYQQAIKDVSQLGLPSYAKGNPEGYLFPATYTIQPGTPPIQVLRKMVQRFNLEASSVNLPAVAAHDQISEADAITIASLIQAEGKRPKDLPRIARVIYDRLNAHMKLQLDTTVLYARNSRAADVTVAQTLDTKSQYNTYLHMGLPPGPIDSPGDAAIKAALHPVHGHHDWLYFLTVNPQTGQTKFTSSYTVFRQYEAELAAYNASHH